MPEPRGIKICIKRERDRWCVYVPTGFAVGKQWDKTAIWGPTAKAAEITARCYYLVDEVEVIGKSGEEG